MQKNQRPQSISLCKVTQHPTGEAITHDYGHDVGYLHRGDYALWASGHFDLLRPERPLRPLRIGRYLDGEEEQRYGAQ